MGSELYKTENWRKWKQVAWVHLFLSAVDCKCDITSCLTSCLSSPKWWVVTGIVRQTPSFLWSEYFITATELKLEHSAPPQPVGWPQPFSLTLKLFCLSLDLVFSALGGPGYVILEGNWVHQGLDIRIEALLAPQQPSILQPGNEDLLRPGNLSRVTEHSRLRYVSIKLFSC